jgi:hypothetical protein
MGVPACRSCDLCGTDLADGPDDHGQPEPHSFVMRFDEETGEPFHRCKRCGLRQALETGVN